MAGGGQAIAGRGAMTRRLLWGGVVGPPLFVVVFLVDGALRPGYDPLRHFVSALLLGDRGWIETITFVLSGVLILALAFGIRRALASGPASRWAPMAVGVVGLGLVVAGLFPGDPGQGYPPGAPEALPQEASWHAHLHFVGAVMIFLFLPIAALMIARRAWRNGDTPFAAYSVATALAVAVFYYAAITLAMSGGPGAEVAGLVQRLSIVSGFQWLTVVAVALLRVPGRLVADHDPAEAEEHEHQEERRRWVLPAEEHHGHPDHCADHDEPGTERRQRSSADQRHREPDVPAQPAAEGDDPERP